MYCSNKSFILIAIICYIENVIRAQSVQQSLCPPQELILPCRCAQKMHEIQVWCSHSDLPRVINGIKSVAKFVEKPIDELILENNQLPSLPSRFFSPLRVVRLMLRNNGVERLASGWLNDMETSLVEIYIVERTLRSLPFDSLTECKKLQAVTIQSEYLKRAPSFAGLLNLRYIKIHSNGLMELPPFGFIDLHSLENIYITNSPKLNRLEAGLFQNLEQLQSLNCQGNGISWIHLRAFGNLPKVNSLDLSRNEISDAGMVGRAIKDLPKLEILKVDHNYITTLAEGSFVDLEYLKELYLNDNAIAEIHHGAFHKTPRLKLLHMENNFLRRVHPESFLQTSGSGLEYLHLQYNEIANIEEVKSLLDALPMLKFLDISYNKLEVVPFGSLRGHGALEQLCLDHNFISRIERDAFMAMPGLRELHLKNNSLSENTPLPFWNLPGLKGLDLSENKFAMLTESLLMGLPSLRRLDISGNELTVIDPNAFSNNIFLETINISVNELSQLHPATFRYLDRMFEIDASFNKLEEVLTNLPRIVERINLESNKIANLPNAPNKVFDLPNLRMLNLGANFIHKIPKNTFKNLYQLRSLSLAQNRIRSIDEHSFNGLTRLEGLNLQDNGIAALHERSFTPLNDLRDLNLQGNNLEILLDNTLSNMHLEKFDASRNNIIEIADNTFANTRMLHSLDLSRNSIRQLPESLATLNELRDVDLSFNQLTELRVEIITAWRKIEELRASNNKLNEIPENTFVDLPALIYLDLSSNELKILNSGSLKKLPLLKELVLADNQLAELNDRTLEDLPNLEVLHLQKNFLRYISPKSFYRCDSIVYLNLSHNNFENMEHIGLRSVRNIEVLDISNNKIKRVATNPLRNLDWLVELKLDNNQICKVQGEPFSSMPRLKVLTMRNNRMIGVSELPFKQLRGNLAFLDLDGNPLDCSCNMLWLRAWYQETNSYPGPRCRDGNLLTELRFSKSDCDTIPDNQLNQVLMTNEHGDVFKRHIKIDDCENEQLDETYNENRPASPVESEYFYEQYIDYPNNDSFSDENRTTHIPSTFNTNNSFIRNNTLLNYNRHKLQQLHHNQKGGDGGSRFTFFGYPLPSFGSFWNNNNGASRKSTSRADVDAYGRSRLRNYKPRPGEILEGFQFSPPRFMNKTDTAPRNNGLILNQHPAALFPENKYQQYIPYYQTTFFDPKVEKGGFVPMLPGRKGFTPIQNPYLNDSNPNVDETQETISTELRPNINIGTDDVYRDAEDNKVLVPTLVTEPSSKKLTVDKRFNVSSLKPNDNNFSATSSNGIPLIRDSTHISTTKSYLPPTPRPSDLQPITSLNESPQTSVQKINTINPDPSISTYDDTSTENHSPITSTFLPNSSDVINLSKNYIPWSAESSTNSNTTRNVLSALVAPGAQQNVFRSPPGRSKITKVFTTTTSTTTSSAPILPTAEEYLRTTGLDNKDGSTPSPYHSSATSTSLNKNSNKLSNEIGSRSKKHDMDWYYSNYNKSTWKEEQPDPGLNRFRNSGVNGSKLHFSSLQHFIVFTFLYKILL